ncbi:MAG: hypothetical protein D6806_01725 [Deltaproteobacteria bacterium]|nr:MAG: hypothetical protein D6806_01725 [Deltaproteobacteria bacterium]
MFRQDTDEAGEKKLSKVDEAFNTSGEYRFFLPAGEYVVRAEQGAVSVRAKAAVKAGKLSKETIVLGAGWLKVRVVDSSKGNPVQVRYIRVWKNVTNAAGEKKLAKVDEVYQGGGGATFFLPAGDYEISAEQEKEIGRESAVIEAGKTAELELRVVSR